MEVIPNGDNNASSDEPPQPIAVEEQVDPEEEYRLTQLRNKVFNLDSLREMIIDYVIHHNRRRLSYPDIKACRLVQKSWLHSVFKLCQKQRVPVFCLNLDKENSLQESENVQQNGKLLEIFLNKALNKTSASFMGEHIPPFAIKATQDFFKAENYTNFKDVLLKCGTGLVTIDLKIPKNGGNMLFIFPFSPQLSLPVLTRFTVQFSNETSYVNTNGTNGNVTAFYLIQSVFNASYHSLKQFTLPFTQEDVIPSGLEFLTLPVALTVFDLSCPLKSEDLKILVNGSLPNLKRLDIVIPVIGFDDGLISSILEKFCETLACVLFSGIIFDSPSDHLTYFKIPVVMKKLKCFLVTSTLLELKDNTSNLETYLPEMTGLSLEYQTISLFRKWTDNSKFINVKTFTLSLVDADFPDDHENYYVNVEPEIMQSIDLTFPNLKILEITVCGLEMNGLLYLLLEMKQLEELEIRVRRARNLMNSDFWDSLLIGVEVETATAMRTTPSFYESFEIKNVSTPSIRNLSNLRTFKIVSDGLPLTVDNIPLISDSVFQFGFLKMPNLKKLVFGGRFAASDVMKRKWRSKTGLEIIHEVGLLD